MRKIIMIFSFSLILIFAAGLCAMADNTMKIGYNFSSMLNDKDVNYNVDGGTVDVGFEFTQASGQVDYGFGAVYQFDAWVTDPTKGDPFRFIPVYAVVNIGFTNDKSIQPYATARVGYSFLSGSDSFTETDTLWGGLYWAAGLGVKFETSKVEVLYAQNNGYRSTGSKNICFSTWSLKLGYNF